MDYTIAPIRQEELVRIRRELHMHPELKWDLPLTAALVKRELDAAGVPYVADQYSPNTIVATINEDKRHFTVGIRADMDALPILERNEDFTYYEKEKPGLLFGLGLRNEAKGAVYPAHTKDWDIDEDGLSAGVKVFVQFVLDNMGGIEGVPAKEG